MVVVLGVIVGFIVIAAVRPDDPRFDSNGQLAVEEMSRRDKAAD